MRIRGCVLALSLFAAGGCLPHPPATGWLRIDTEHVRLRTNFDEARALSLANDLQEIRDALASSALRCGFERKTDRIEVVALYGEHFRAVTGQKRAFFRWLDRGDLDVRGAQIVVPGGSGWQARRTFQHEIVHQLAYACFPGAPAWLQEGLAGFLETASVKKSKLELGLPAFLVHDRGSAITSVPYRGVPVIGVPGRHLPTAVQLVSMDPDQFYTTRIAAIEAGAVQEMLNYATAWGLVHMLELGDAELRPHFARYLAALKHGKEDPDVAWAAEFEGVDLNARLKRYMTQSDWPYYEVAYTVPRRTPPEVHRMSAGEGHVQVGWLAGIRGDEGIEEVLANAAQAKAYPSSRASAYQLAALAHRSHGSSASARKEIREGLRVAPKNAALLQLWAEIELVETASGTTAGLTEASRRLSAVAETAEQFATLATSEMSRGNLPRALVLSRRAVSQRPDSWYCHVVRASVLAAHARLPEAKTHLETAIRFVSHYSPGLRKSLGEALEKLERSQSFRALGSDFVREEG